MLAVGGFRALALAVVGVLVAGLAVVLGSSSVAKAAPGDFWDLDVTVTSADLPSVEGVPVYVSQELSSSASQVFLPPIFQGLTGPGGVIHVPDLPEGIYLVVADAGDGWVQGTNFVPLFTDTLESLDIVPGVVLSGTIRDAGTGANLPDKAVRACGTLNPGAGCYFNALNLYADFGSSIVDPLTAPGVATYRFTVPFGDDYELSVYDPLGAYADQNWDHRSGCGCGSDLIEVDPAGIVNHSGPYDFDLFPDDGTITWDLYVEDPAANPIDMVTSRLLYHGAAGLVQADVFDTDPTGFVELFGTTAGDYAITFAINGSYYPVVSLDAGGGPIAVNSCQLEFPGVAITDSFLVTVVIDHTGQPCGHAPPSAPTPTTKKATRFASSVFATFATTTETPAPSATPTSSPSPSSSPSSEPSSSASPTPPPVVNQDFDVWWLWIVLAVIVALILFFLVLLIKGRP